ncbi:MAG: Nuclease inhibitor-like protein [Phycisphaerales bacterium]|nr:Nuclease inhibitor-like protein [Phycisphaerales bacterium]
MPSSTPQPPHDDLLEALKMATNGLLYPSESDEPFEPFRWKRTTDDPAKEVAAHDKPGAKIREQSVDEFFAGLAESDDAKKFADLRRELESRLSGLRVFRVGDIEVGVYLIGKTPSGDWAGLRTTSVET